jgi:NADH-quinone oxidoreductase subunit L
MYLFIIFSCLFNSFLISVGGKYLGRQAVITITLCVMWLTLFILLIILNETLVNHNTCIITLYHLATIYDIKLSVGFLLDGLAIIMSFIVIIISTLVHTFTAGYMSHDPFIVRFYSYLGLFTFFMLLLVTSDNFLQLFVG